MAMAIAWAIAMAMTVAMAMAVAMAVAMVWAIAMAMANQVVPVHQVNDTCCDTCLDIAVGHLFDTLGSERPRKFWLTPS